ncbi:PQQ-binding-like beta-propeller repeat protein [Occultella aeris]|uniref:Uncharacterized protein n=1 Tax=Occultella aeris TaxID=2761496 RepID=A0A7M4DLM6_9MICO|nr:PQQ-binding-like beta-propeller repeat protein [Occultella aeris]VZO38198.1 hypothetical protein HALOF300_03043 [Occultella aeris]
MSTKRADVHGPARFTGRLLAVIGAGLLLVAAGCADSDPQGSEDPGGSGSTGPTSDAETTDPDPAGPTTGDWVEVPPGSVLLASTVGTAVLAVGAAVPSEAAGERVDGAVTTTRDVAAYDAAGAVRWEFPGVVEDYYDPTVVATTSGVALLSPEDGGTRLTLVDWATGEEVWSLGPDDLGGCRQWRFTDLPESDVIALTSDGPPCPGTEPDRAGVVTIDAATGATRDAYLPSAGTITTVLAPATAEVWSVELTDTALTVQRFDPASGAVDARAFGWDAEHAAELRALSAHEHNRIEQVGPDLAVVQRWGGEGLVASYLMDWTTEIPGFTSGDAVGPCFGEALAARDVPSAGCLAQDLGTDDPPLTSAGFDGTTRWEMPGSAGLTMEVPARVTPVHVGQDRAWVVSTGSDLLTAVDVETGKTLWVVGAGEGAGEISQGYLAEGRVLVAAVAGAAGGPGEVVRVDVATGAELDRHDYPGGWVSSTDTAAVVTGAEAALLTVVIESVG